MAELLRVETAAVTLQISVSDRAPAVRAHHPGAFDLSPTRGVQAACFVYGVSVPPASVAGPALFEETEYRILLRSKTATAVALFHSDPLLLADLQTTADGTIVYGTINFRSQVGRTALRVIAAGAPQFECSLEVFPSKLDYANDYEDILRDLQDQLRTIVLAYLRATFRLGVRMQPGTPRHIEWLLSLRAIIGDLENAVRHIASRPLRTIAREIDQQSLHRIRRVHSVVRTAVARGRGSGELMQLGASGVAAHERIPADVAIPTLDTPEHRWILAQLFAIRRRLARIRAIENRLRKSARRDAIVQELTDFESRVSALSRVDVFRGLAAANVSGFASLQLLRTPGYREAYVAATALSFLLSIESDRLQLPVKELSTLFEYWCFLIVSKSVADLLGTTIDFSQLISIEQDGIALRLQRGAELTLQLEGGSATVTVSYNPSLSSKAMLVTQRPDVMLTIDRSGWPPIRLILDAKYRLDASPEYVGRFSMPGPPEDALSVLHRYRDAVLELDGGAKPSRTIVKGAALFPYREQLAGEFQGSRLALTLASIGIGAIPVLPGSVQHLQQWLRDVLLSAGAELASSAISNSTDATLNARRDAARQVVLAESPWIGSAAEIEALRAQRIWYTQPATEVLRGVHFVAVLDERITVYRVKTVSLSQLGETGLRIDEQRQSEVVLRYELDEPLMIHELRPAPAARFLTSLLAFQRASSLAELYVASDAEWQIIDAVAAAGLKLEVRLLARADALRLRDRVEIITRAGAIRYHGAGLAAVSDESGERLLTFSELITLLKLQQATVVAETGS